MAAGFISTPGTKYGPCKEQCEHKDCAANRKIAESSCRICKEKIGFDRRFFQEKDWTVFVHMVCFEEEIEKQRTKGGE